MFELSGSAKLVEIFEFFLVFGVARDQSNAPALETSKTAASEHVHRKIHRDGAGMKEVQGPDVHGPAGQVHPAWRLSMDRVGSGEWVSGQGGYSLKNRA